MSELRSNDPGQNVLEPPRLLEVRTFLLLGSNDLKQNASRTTSNVRVIISRLGSTTMSDLRSNDPNQNGFEPPRRAWKYE